MEEPVMDPFFIGLLIGLVAGIGGMVSVVLRANKVPTGRTARLLAMVGRKSD
jgi:hypothetical protein